MEVETARYQLDFALPCLSKELPDTASRFEKVENAGLRSVPTGLEAPFRALHVENRPPLVENNLRQAAKTLPEAENCKIKSRE